MSCCCEGDELEAKKTGMQPQSSESLIDLRGGEKPGDC